jgi:hypothetical protein
LRAGRALQAVSLIWRQPFYNFFEGGTVRLRKKYIKCDRCRVAFGEPEHEIAHDRSWPRPLSETRNRFRIDVDDADRQIWIIGLRRQSLIGVESNQPQRLHKERIGAANAYREHEKSAYEREVKAADSCF